VRRIGGFATGGPAGDDALTLVPAFHEVAKIGCSKIEITNMQPTPRTATDTASFAAAKPWNLRPANSER
jgi:hypothetical protein